MRSDLPRGSLWFLHAPGPDLRTSVMGLGLWLFTMKSHPEHDAGPRPRERSERDLMLDLEVGLRVEGYRWVQWNHRAIADAPLDEPGRFVGHPGDLLAHLYMEAAPDVPLSDRPYARLPRYSLEPGPALRAAERAGLFVGGGVAVSCSSTGTWKVGWSDIELEDDCFPRLLSRAALRLVAGDVRQGDH